MIAILAGTVLEKYNNKLLIMVNGGVGYEVSVSAPLFLDSEKGTDVLLYTYLKSSDSGMELFGFKDSEEKSFFEMLITVSGVGPRGALNIMSLGSITEIKDAIGRSDVAYLTQVSGIGRRTAERVTVELKEKVGVREDAQENLGEALGEMIDALTGLGYTKEQARAIAKTMDAAGKTTEELLKIALRELSS